jgi:hypothetical protein
MYSNEAVTYGWLFATFLRMLNRPVALEAQRMSSSRRARVDHTHHAIHGAEPDAVQGFLALIASKVESGDPDRPSICKGSRTVGLRAAGTAPGP